MGAKAAKAQLRAMAMRRCAFHTNPPVILIAIAAVLHEASCKWTTAIVSLFVNVHYILGYGFWTAHRCVCATEILYKPTRDDSRAAKVDSTSCAALIMICVRCSRKANIISCGNSREARKDCARNTLLLSCCERYQICHNIIKTPQIRPIYMRYKQCTRYIAKLCANYIASSLAIFCCIIYKNIYYAIIFRNHNYWDTIYKYSIQLYNTMIYLSKLHYFAN